MASLPGGRVPVAVSVFPLPVAPFPVTSSDPVSVPAIPLTIPVPVPVPIPATGSTLLSLPLSAIFANIRVAETMTEVGNRCQNPCARMAGKVRQLRCPCHTLCK